MPDLPHPWAAYTRLQHKLWSKSRIDDHAWGFEAGLNLILAAHSTVNQPSQEDIDRAMASGARLERSRVAQLRSLCLEYEEFADPNADPQVIEAGEILQLLESRVTADDWVLLCEVAAGHEYVGIAARRGVTAGGLRARVLRLRRSLVALAA